LSITATLVAGNDFLEDPRGPVVVPGESAIVRLRFKETAMDRKASWLATATRVCARLFGGSNAAGAGARIEYRTAIVYVPRDITTFEPQHRLDEHGRPICISMPVTRTIRVPVEVSVPVEG
jgi:hypothetical protein